MIQMRDFQKPAPKKNACGKPPVFSIGGSEKAGIENELQLVEREIAHATDKSRELADELGLRYAFFRCAYSPYDDESGIRDEEIMNLSKRTDECIETVYKLEKRRRELLQEIGK